MFWEPVFWKVIEVAEPVARTAARAARTEIGSIFVDVCEFLYIYIYIGFESGVVKLMQ